MRFTTNFVYRTSNEIIHALHHLPPLKEWSLYLITATACEASAESFRSLYSRFYKRCMSESEESIELLPYSHSPLPEADWDLKSDLSVTNEYMNNFKTKMYDPCEDMEIQYTEDDSFLIDQDDTSVDTNKIYSRYSSFRTNSSPYTNALDATAPNSTSDINPRDISKQHERKLPRNQTLEHDSSTAGSKICNLTYSSSESLPSS